METTIVYWGNIGRMENEMETTETTEVVYWGNIGFFKWLRWVSMLVRQSEVCR